jgi:hypothetical protein
MNMAARALWALGALTAFLSLSSTVWARDPDPAMNQPDMVAWQLFAQVTRYAATPGNNNALFETWASDPDTFNLHPQWPAGSAPKPLVASALARGILGTHPRMQVAPPPGSCVQNWKPGQTPCIGEEVRRNHSTFDFIVQNNLYTQAGLAKAFGSTISFPVGSIEVKADWIPVDELPSWNGTNLADVNSLYHVNTVKLPNGTTVSYALVAMHLISKRVPNWTWATFEHWKNPGRCDAIGCHDDFGAVQANVAPNAQPNQGYPDCTHTGALKQLFSAQGLGDVWQNYCLKGTQTDFITATGQTTLLGNSVIEGLNAGVPVNQSSCMTCHATAAFNKQGSTLVLGFANNETGAPQPVWYSGPGPYNPYPYQQADFVWAIPACAVPNGKTTSPCAP